MDLKRLRTIVDRKHGQRSQIENNLTAFQDELKQITKTLARHEKAREIIREVGLQTQQQLQFHISDVTSLALESVFNDPYQLKVDFVQRRNKTECDLLFVKGDSELDPLTASGGGAVDVAAFALRIASWSMSHPRTRATIILDEPLRFLSVDNQEKASRMIKELSQRLGLQFIIVTHESVLASYADKVFEVSIKKGKSKVVST